MQEWPGKHLKKKNYEGERAIQTLIPTMKPCY